MAEVNNGRKAQSIKLLLDAYGIAVRAGVITPQKEDEVEFRKLLKLPAMSPAVEADWAAAEGIRKPVTLKALETAQDTGEENEDEL